MSLSYVNRLTACSVANSNELKPDPSQVTVKPNRLNAGLVVNSNELKPDPSQR
jgi:hypothetical protein